MEHRSDTAMDSAPDSESAEMSLRDHLLAAHAYSQQASQSPPPQQHNAPQPGQSAQPNGHGQRATPPDVQAQASPMQLDPQSQQQHAPPQSHQPQQLSPHVGTQIDPQMYYPASSHAHHGVGTLPHHSAAQQMAVMDSHDDGSPNSQSARAKRELSNSKRAAQNRAAQRAFRQRKDTYIKKLEEDVRNSQALPALQSELQRVQQDNFHMREYIIQLQLRLLDVCGEFPPPPAPLELRDPRSGEPLRAAQPAPTPEDGAGQGGPPPPPQPGHGGPAPTASMTGEGEYPSMGADGKVGVDGPYPGYEAKPVERPQRPPPDAGREDVKEQA